jgi:3-hydroxyacyl-CoA dehydrogenase
MLSDNEALDFIRDANIDVFWGREESTVSSNLQEGIRMEKMMERLGMPLANPLMGPFPLEDVFGMKMAVAVLDRSLDPGVYEKNVQWDTFRRLRSGGTNISQAGVFGLSDCVGAYESNKLWISKVVTHQFWFG